ncbi:hypothetical protein [Kangiella japonica]
MSISIFDLWLAIILSGLFAWIASAIIHMVIKYHNSDYKRLSDENAVSDSLSKSADKAGLYTLPHCADFNEMNDPAVQARFKKGPVAIVTIFEKGLPPMGKLLSLQFLYFVIGSFLIGYIGTIGLAPGATTLEIFKLLFVTGFICYGWASIPYSIWFGHPWLVTIKYLIDSVIYSVVTAATFCWFWP